MKMLISARRELWNDVVALHFAVEWADGLSAAEPLVFKHLDSGMVSSPCMNLRRDDAQRLMDELWNVGLRPSEGSGSAGQLAAVQNHLEDMRTIAMSQLGIA